MILITAFGRMPKLFGSLFRVAANTTISEIVRFPPTPSVLNLNTAVSERIGRSRRFTT